MKTITTKQRQIARVLRRVAALLGSADTTSPVAKNSAYRFAAGTGASAVVVACANAHAIAATEWHMTPKFGKFDHFQRWRFAT